MLNLTKGLNVKHQAIRAYFTAYYSTCLSHTKTRSGALACDVNLVAVFLSHRSRITPPIPISEWKNKPRVEVAL
jgi:hypothetical protein